MAVHLTVNSREPEVKDPSLPERTVEVGLIFCKAVESEDGNNIFEITQASSCCESYLLLEEGALYLCDSDKHWFENVSDLPNFV